MIGQTSCVSSSAAPKMYALLLPRCSSVYIAVLAAAAEGDAFMPPFEAEFPVITVLETLPGTAEWRQCGRMVKS